MCFYVTSGKKTAENDIIVYKVLFEDNISPFYNYRYNCELQPKVELTVRYTSSVKRIHQGYHFGKTKEIARKLYRSIFHNYIALFVIPKGTQYYENEEQIVAETCKLLTKREIKNLEVK